MKLDITIFFTIIGVIISSYATVVVTLQVSSFLIDRILGHLKVWGVVIDYLIHRKKFKEWLKSRD